MSHQINVTPELITDLNTIAELMKKHNLSFGVNVEGDTHGLSYESVLLIGWKEIICGEHVEVDAAAVLCAKAKIESLNS